MTNVNLVFVVDGDSSARKGIARLVRTANYEVRDFDSANKFLNALGYEVPGCVVLDAETPELSGEELQAELKACGAHPPIIIVTALDDLQSRQKAEKLNAVAFFRKPVDGTALLDAIDWSLRSSGTSSTQETM